MARHRLGTGKKKAVGAKRKTTRRRSRRRMGAAGSLEPIIMNGLAAGAGMLAVTEINNILDNSIQAYNTNSIMSPLVQAGIGLGAAVMSKDDFIRYMGIGAIGKGLYSLGTLFIPGMTVSGPGQLTYHYRAGMGDPRLQFVAGPTSRIGAPAANLPMVAGYAQRKKQRQFVS